MSHFTFPMYTTTLNCNMPCNALGSVSVQHRQDRTA